MARHGTTKDVMVRLEQQSAQQLSLRRPLMGFVYSLICAFNDMLYLG